MFGKVRILKKKKKMERDTLALNNRHFNFSGFKYEHTKLFYSTSNASTHFIKSLIFGGDHRFHIHMKAIELYLNGVVKAESFLS